MSCSLHILTFNFDITLLFILISDIFHRRRVLRARQHVSSVWVSELVFCFEHRASRNMRYFVFIIFSLDRSISMGSLGLSVFVACGD